MKGLLFTYTVCYGGSLVALWKPYYGLLAYICFALIKPESTWFWSVPASNYSRIIAMALIVGWVINGCGGFHLGKSKLVVGSLIGFFVWICISTLFSPDSQLGYEYAEAQFKIILPVVIGATLIQSRADLRQLAWTIALCMGYLALELNVYYFQGNNVLARDGFGGMDNNSFAIGLVTAVGLCFFLGLGTKSVTGRILAFASAALISHAILFSMSRGAMIALCVVGVVSFFLIPKKPSYVVFLTVGALLAVYMGSSEEVYDEFISAFASSEERDESAESRIILWKACLSLMKQSPIVGIGPDQFTNNVHLVTPYEQGKEAHTLWLTTGAEIGVMGLCFILTYYLGTMWVLYRNSRDGVSPDPFDGFLPVMVISSLTGFMVAAQFVSLERLEIPYYVALLGAGAIKLHELRKREIVLRKYMVRMDSENLNSQVPSLRI